MEAATSYFGTWEEIKAHAAEFGEHKMVVKVIKDPVIVEQLERLERGLTMAREASQGLGPFPKREITLDVLYPDEYEPR